MKKALLLSAVLLVSAFGFADASINNFTGYNNYWHPFGAPDTSTYGELFIVPQGESSLNSFSFYTGQPYGDNSPIVLGAYIATWDSINQRAGTLVYSSAQYTYDNAGNEELTFSTNGVHVTAGQQYVMFLSTSMYENESTGQTWVPSGSTSDYLAGFVFNNNGADFDALFSTSWGSALKPDWAVDLEFTNATPEPSSLVMLGTGLIGLAGMFRRKLF